MKRLSYPTVAAVVFLISVFSCYTSWAATNEAAAVSSVSIADIEIIGSDDLAGTKDVRITIRYTNGEPIHISTANGFLLGSTNGGMWDSVKAGSLALSFESNDDFDEVALIRKDCDGLSPDTVGFLGICSMSSGVPVGFDDLSGYIDVYGLRTRGFRTTYCIDSSSFFPGLAWEWVRMNVGPTTHFVPQWGGPICFTVSEDCCSGVKGNLDMDPGESVDITDLQLMIDRLFFGQQLPLCTGELNIDDDLMGSIDISDLQGLIDFMFFAGTLPSCE